MCGMKGDNQSLPSCLVGLMIAAAIGPATLHPRVVNRANDTIWVRPEQTLPPVAIPPGGSFGGVDALAQPGVNPGRIFRACDYCSVIVPESGRVAVLCGGLASNACQVIRGGWKDERWLRRQNSWHDHDWDALFTRAGLRVTTREE